MPLVLTNGKISIGAYQLPDKKKIALCVEEGNGIYTCGYFTKPKHAEFFMQKLAECVGAKMDGERSEK